MKLVWILIAALLFAAACNGDDDDMSRRILDGSRSEFSGRVVMAPGDEPKEIFSVSSENSSSPEGIVLNIDVTATGTFPVSGGRRLLAIDLEWGVGKAQFAASIDALKGTRVFLTASALRVSASYIAADGQSYAVAAAAVYGSADTPRPTKTVYTGVVTAGASVTVPVPKYAASVRSYAINAGASANVVATNVAGVPFNLAILATALDQEVELPNGTEFIRIDNTGVGTTAYVLVFRLSL